MNAHYVMFKVCVCLELSSRVLKCWSLRVPYGARLCGELIVLEFGSVRAVRC